MITRSRKTKRREPPPPPPSKKKPKLKTNSHEETKKNEIEAISDPSGTEDAIDILLERFFTSCEEPASNKQPRTVENEELHDGECSRKRKREIPQSKNAETRVNGNSKKPTRACKNAIERDGVLVPPSQRDQDRFFTSRGKTASNKANTTVEPEELLNRECSSKRKSEKCQSREKNKSKNLEKGNKRNASNDVLESDKVFCPPSRPRQVAEERLDAASIEDDPETATTNFGGKDVHQPPNPRVVETPPGKRKKCRGSASLACLTEDNGGVREVLEYNTEGQPIGPVAKKFSTYIGVLARRMVPIIHETWHKVPKELKETLLKNVEAKYVIDSKKRKKVLSAIGERWKTFKVNLNKYFIRPFKNRPELLGCPPEQYWFIEQEHWSTFVMSRLSEEFENYSKYYASKRAMSTYNHRLGRKGYVGFVEELKQSLGASADEIDRSDLWKKARQDKNGVYLDDVVRKKAELIDEMKKQKEDGNLVTNGGRDILTWALGTLEHSNRVRGVGSFLSPNTYFRRPKRNSKKHISVLQQKVNQGADKILERNQVVGELQAPTDTTHSTSHSTESISQIECMSHNDDHPLHFGSETGCQSSGNLNARFDMPSPDSNSTAGKSKCCSLAVDSRTNIVARGMVYEEVKPNEKIHNVPLGENNVRVTVEYAISPNTLLPVPVIGEMTMVKDAIGSFVAWPKKFLLTGVEEEENEGAAEESGPIQAFASFVDQMVLTDNIIIPMQSAIFEADIEARIYKVDLMHLCNMQGIAASCIVTYIRFLYENLSDSQKSYGFVDPASMSSAKGPDASSMITKRLQIAERGQLVFVPYKTKGHWALIVIESASMNVYWLDPLQKPPPMDIKIYVTSGLRALQVNDKTRPNPTWHPVKCPKQPLEDQCGYYVMRYMKEVMEDSTQPLAGKLGKKITYSRGEIDEVRLELIDFILTKM